MEFVTWDLYAAINIRECAVLETRPAEPTRSSIVGQPLRLEVHKAKLQPMAGAGQELLGGVWDWIYIYLPWLWIIAREAARYFFHLVDWALLPARIHSHRRIRSRTILFLATLRSRYNTFHKTCRLLRNSLRHFALSRAYRTGLSAECDNASKASKTSLRLACTFLDYSPSHYSLLR
jgi:hypothetical protein